MFIKEYKKKPMALHLSKFYRYVISVINYTPANIYLFNDEEQACLLLFYHNSQVGY